MNRMVGIVGASIGLMGVLGTASTVSADARVIITEIMYNPASEESKGQTEWVEIANVGDSAIDIKDWRLDDEDKTEWGTFSCRLEAGGVAVIVNTAGTDEAQFREAWVPASESQPSVDSETDSKHTGPKSSAKKKDEEPPSAGSFLVIPVKWGGIANAPSEDNENLKLVDSNNQTICEVIFSNGGKWPSVKRPDGFSIYLTDVNAKELSDPEIWKKSAEDEAGAIRCRTNKAFDSEDVGSPGYVPGLKASKAPDKPKDEPVATDDQPKKKTTPHVIDY